MTAADKLVADDWAEPFHVRYGRHDLGLHLDVRLCLLRASQSHQTRVVYVSETEDSTADQSTPVKNGKREAFQVQSECWAPKRRRR